MLVQNNLFKKNIKTKSEIGLIIYIDLDMDNIMESKTYDQKHASVGT